MKKINKLFFLIFYFILNNHFIFLLKIKTNSLNKQITNANNIYASRTFINNMNSRLSYSYLNEKTGSQSDLSLSQYPTNPIICTLIV